MIRVKRGAVPRPAVLGGEEADEAYAKARAHFAKDAPLARQQLFKFEPLYGHESVRAALSELFARKCAFCESVIDPAAASPITHHFRPKQEAVGADGTVSRPHYWWLVYEWENLYLSCQRCATAAGAQFPVAGDRAAVGARGPALESEQALLVDPCLDDPDEHLLFQADGSVSARSPRGQHTIAVYALNRRPLVEARRQAIAAASDPALERRSDRKQPYAAAIRQVLGAPPAHAAPPSFSRLRALGRRLWSTIEPFIERVRRGGEPAPPVQAAIVERLELRDFRGIERLELELADPDEQAPWTMLLGENGHGKTSVLQALALVLMGAKARAELDVEPASLIRESAPHAEIVAHMRGVLEPRTLRITRERFEAGGDDSAIALAAYGAARIPSTRRRGAPKIDPGEPRVGNLFDAAAPLTAADRWLLGRDEAAFDFVARALRRLLVESGKARSEKEESEKTQVLRGEGGVELRTPGGPPVDIGQLSDGYRSMIALAVDVMSFFMTRYESMDAARGVVLVDELGAHLHPRWQMRVVEGFREAFPGLQFVATTHDPLCLRGLRGKREVVVLRRTSAGRIFALPPAEVPEVAGLRVDELLTSEVFGMSSTIDPELEREFDRYYELLAMPELGPDDSAELAALKDKLDRYRQLGSTWRERLALEEADKYLAREGEVAERAARDELLEETKQRLRDIWTRPVER